MELYKLKARICRHCRLEEGDCVCGEANEKSLIRLMRCMECPDCYVVVAEQDWDLHISECEMDKEVAEERGGNGPDEHYCMRI